MAGASGSTHGVELVGGAAAGGASGGGPGAAMGGAAGQRADGHGQAAGAAAATGAARAPLPPVVSSFSGDQLGRLRQQIAVFKKIKKGEFDFPFPGRPDATAALGGHGQQQQMQLQQQQQQQQRAAAPVGFAAAAAAAQRSGLPGMPVHNQGAGGAGVLPGRPMQQMPPGQPQYQQQQMPPPPQQQKPAPPPKKTYNKQPKPNYPQPPPQSVLSWRTNLPSQRPLPANLTAMPPWVHAPSRPLYEVAMDAAPADAPGRQFGCSPTPVVCDVRALLEGEATRQLAARRRRRLVEVQGELRRLDEGDAAGAYTRPLLSST